MKNKFIVWLGIIVLATPIVMYSAKFGFGFWDEHKEWANLGAFFGGVLGPITMLFSVMYLSYQIKEQVRNNELTEKNRKIESLNSEIKEYQNQILEVFKKPGFTEKIKKEHNELYQFEDKEKQEKSKELKMKYQDLFSNFIMLEFCLGDLLMLDKKAAHESHRRIMVLIDNYNLLMTAKILENSFEKSNGYKPFVISLMKNKQKAKLIEELKEKGYL